jgi:predicted 3-demethylubiquinone-9 3-methyltransferase (glyoxalase superfamily)
MPTFAAPSSRISPCLWFDHEAEPAAQLYVSVFPDSRITQVARYPEAGQEIHGRKAGSVMTVAFELSGQSFTALNGGPVFRFNEAISLQVHCENQEEVDHYWSRLSQGGDPAAQQCGWIKDRYGLSWQIVPNRLIELVQDPDPVRREKAFAAMLKMKKIDIAAIERAVAG